MNDQVKLYRYMVFLHLRTQFSWGNFQTYLDKILAWPDISGSQAAEGTVNRL